MEKLLVGEHFISKITHQVRKSDAIIAILSEHSARSQWCQAELHQAIALEKMIFPIRIGKKDFHLPITLEHLQTSINYTTLKQILIFKMLSFQ